MYTLGIETSCDETAVAITNRRKILSNVVTSSVPLHSKFGGVVPEIASRFHLEYINPVLKESLKKAGLKLKDVKLIAVTTTPGLVGSLLVGISMAKALSFALSVPLIEVNHLIAHLYANIMCYRNIKFPLIGLVVSGGHTSLIWMEDIDNWEVLGRTQDDAAGEAFDKVAKILDLGYPGGPVIERRASKGNSKNIKFPRSSLKQGTYDFSFSGIKTAVLYYVKRHIGDVLYKSNFTGSGKGEFGQYYTGEIETTINDICASFQEAVFDMIIQNTISACRMKSAKTLLAGGGVIANKSLRKRLSIEAKNLGVNAYFPPVELCLDNGAMVGGLGEALYSKLNII